MTMKKWPFPGDAPVIKARKMCLAYRHVLEQKQRALLDIRQALEKLDRRLIAFDNPASLALIDDALKVIGDTDELAELDQRFTSWGETWHCEQPDNFGPDDFVKTNDAGKILHVNPKTVTSLRIKGRLKGHWDPDMGTSGGYWYQVRDLYALSATLRGRGWRTKGSTDTITDSGRNDAE